MKILVVSDAWHPQINGVVRTYESLSENLIKQGHEIVVLGPQDCKYRFSMPGYSEIQLAYLACLELPPILRKEITKGTLIHIATEGPMGLAARYFCKKNNLSYTTIYHTEFPDYISKRVARYLPVLKNISYKFALNFIRWFHKDSQTIFVATKSLAEKLKLQNFKPSITFLTRGIDPDIFHINQSPIPEDLKNIEKPIALYVGRVAIEKNLEKLCESKWQGSKVIIGTGPDVDYLKKTYPDCIFLGKKTGSDLGNHYRACDLFVFPSRTDTFGMVLIEALACGLPVAAYPVTGPIDIITEDFLGSLDEDLSLAMNRSYQQKDFKIQRAAYTKENYNWQLVTKQFLDGCQK